MCATNTHTPAVMSQILLLQMCVCLCRRGRTDDEAAEAVETATTTATVATTTTAAMAKRGALQQMFRLLRSSCVNVFSESEAEIARFGLVLLPSLKVVQHYTYSERMLTTAATAATATTNSDNQTAADVIRPLWDVSSCMAQICLLNA